MQYPRGLTPGFADWAPSFLTGERNVVTNLSERPLSGVTVAEAEFAVYQGMDIWNEQADAGYFTLEGTTTADDFDIDINNCSSAEIGRVLVTTRNVTTLGAAAPRCIDSSGIAWSARVYAGTVNNTWGVGDVGSGEMDLVHNFAHELGHTLDLGHPSGTFQAVMQQSGGTQINRRRDLYEYDIECARQLAGKRSIRGRARYTTSGHQLGSEFIFTNAGVTEGVAAFTKSTGTWDFGALYHQGNSVYWTRGLNTSNLVNVGSANATHMSSHAVFPNSPSAAEHIFYLDVDDWPTEGAANAKHYAIIRTSTDGFVTSSTWSVLRHCASMSAWMTCSATDLVYSGKRLVAAWDDFVDQAHFVWVNQNRNSDQWSRRILISTGMVNGNTLPQPNSLQGGVLTNSTPAIACDTYSANGYDCMIAYTMQNEFTPIGEVWVSRFWASADTNNYKLNWDSLSTMVSPSFRTAAALTAWYKDGYFYVAARRAAVGNQVQMYRSADTVNWSYIPDNAIGMSVVGPSAVNSKTGTNVLTYWQ